MSTWPKNMVSAKCKTTAMFGDFGSIQMIVTGAGTVSRAEHSRGPCQEEFTRKQQQQQRKQQQQTDIEQVTIEMGMMRNELTAQEADGAKQNMFVIYYRIDEKCFETFADIIEKMGSYKKFYEQFGKFLKLASMRIRPLRQRLPSWCGSAIRSLVMSLTRLKKHVGCMEAVAE